MTNLIQWVLGDRLLSLILKAPYQYLLVSWICFSTSEKYWKNLLFFLCYEKKIVLYFQVNSVAFSPDFQIMVTGCDDQRVRVFNTSTGKLVCKLKGHTGSIFVICCCHFIYVCAYMHEYVCRSHSWLLPHNCYLEFGFLWNFPLKSTRVICA